MNSRILLILSALLLGSPVLAASSPRIVVPARDIARGEVITQADLAYVPVAVGVQPGLVMSIKQLVGLETRRALRTGESLRAQDFRHPVVVTKGTLVTMTYNVPGITLTASMRAIASGGVGETITVQNPISYRQVAAIITGPGQVQAIGTSGLDIVAQSASANP